jgi:alpha-galactosidase
MAKIVIIGAGSHVFASRLITDILYYPELRDSTISLMDIAREPLELTTAFAKRIVEQNKFNTRIESTTDRRAAVDGADYVFITINAGYHWKEADRAVTLKYGVDQGDTATMGPCGVFNGARHVPPILDICHDMEELCPDAWLMNYTNPMAMISWAVSDYTHVKNIGLCHSVPNTARTLAGYMDVPFNELSYTVAGINHFAWFLELKWRGQDAYPLLREKLKNTAIYADPRSRGGQDIVRVALFQTFGYYVTESSGHAASYTPYFRKKPETIEKYGLSTGSKYQSNARMWMSQDKDKDNRLAEQLRAGYRFPVDHSSEFGSIIIHSIETGEPAVIYGDVKNKGLITNLSDGCCVEVPCLVDKEGIHPCYVGDLPPQLAALNQSNVNVQELAVQGIVEKDKTKIFRSILLDPITSAMLTIDETRRMVDELFQGDKPFLKGYK